MKERSRTKQFIINFGAQAFSFGANLIISFFITPYIIETISSEAYGFVGLANNFTSYVSVLTAALNSMFGRFVTISYHRNDIEKANKYFSSVFFSNLLVSVPFTFISVFVIVFIDKIINVSSSLVFDVRILWSFVFLSFILGLIFTVFSVATFVKNRLDLASLRSIESNGIRVAVILIMFYFLKPSVWFLGFASFVCNLYVIITNIFYTKRLLPEIHIRKRDFDFKMVKELIMSGIWNSVSHLSSILSNGLDLLITNLMVTSKAMGVVSVSKTVPSVILSAFGTISYVFSPELTISYAKRDFDDIKKQLISAIKILSFFACIPISFIYIFGKEFYSLWVPSQDASLLHMLTIVGMLAAPVGWCLEPLWNIFTVTNKVKTSSLFLLSNAVASTALVFILLPFAKTETVKMYIVVGTSAVISIIRNITFLPIFGAKCLGFKKTIFYPEILKSVFSIAVISLISYFIRTALLPDSWLKLIICGVIVSIISVIFNYFVLLGKRERITLINKLTKIFNK